MAPATAAGYSVIPDPGNNRHACDARMVNGPVRVKKGDTVSEGRVIGRRGNTGNADIPLRHFRVVTGDPAFPGSKGYPRVCRSFNVTGTVNDTPGAERTAAPGFTATRLWTEWSLPIPPCSMVRRSRRQTGFRRTT